MSKPELPIVVDDEPEEQAAAVPREKDARGIAMLLYAIFLEPAARARGVQT